MRRHRLSRNAAQSDRNSSARFGSPKARLSPSCARSMHGGAGNRADSQHSTLKSRSTSPKPRSAVRPATLRLTPENFREAVAPARTFALAAKSIICGSLGFAKGGSLDNAVVVDGARVLNPGGLRMKDEFVGAQTARRRRRSRSGRSGVAWTVHRQPPRSQPEQQTAAGTFRAADHLGRHHAAAHGRSRRRPESDPSRRAMA